MTALLIAAYIVCAAYMILNFKYDLQMLQQNSYRIDRYWRWLSSNLTTTWRLVDIVLLFALFTSLIPFPGAVLLCAIVSIVKCILILRKKSKKPLVFTRRIWRIYGVTSIIALCIFVPAACSIGVDVQDRYLMALPLAVLLLITIFSWSVVIAAVWLLSPVEKMINRKYYNEASSILASMPELTVIGITGSYGKTSTKHYLQRILSESFDVLMTPGSYNTPMGVIRTIREMMKPYNQIFICEMGAKQVGDIKEICDLVHPQIGVVTAVGPMHLESFKSIENVQATKFELIDSLPADGFAVVNDDFEYCASREVKNVEALRYRVGGDEKADYRAIDVKYSSEGSKFTLLCPDGQRIDFHSRLVGDCNISNLVAAIIIGLRLGVPKEKIQYAVADIRQVEHRLSINRTAGGVTIIDDAFNSNPTGSRMALDVLASFKEGKRIVVTPGMIELGSREEELNHEFGRYIARSADLAIVVGQYNRDAICSGAKEGGMTEENIITAGSFLEAQQILSGLLSKGDTVLYENDLPDTFK